MTTSSRSCSNWVFTSHSTQNRSFRRRFPISGLGIEKLNLTQQKHAFTNQKKCTTTQNKLKPSLVASYLRHRHPDWKRRGSILISALHHLLTTLIYLQPRDPHVALQQLHWLPARQRAGLKLAVLYTVYKALNNLAPSYLSDNCQLVTTAGCRQLRSADKFKCTFIRPNTSWRSSIHCYRTTGA